MAELLTPGVFIDEVAGPRPVQPVGTSTAAFVGKTQKGKAGVPLLVTNFSEFEHAFGGFADDSATHTARMYFAVKHFFQEGGTRAYVMKVEGAGGNKGSHDVTDVASPSHTAFTAQEVSFGVWTATALTLVIDDATDGSNHNSTDATFNLEIKSGDTVLETFENLSMSSSAGPKYVANALAAGNSDYITLTGSVGTTRPANAAMSLVPAANPLPADPSESQIVDSAMLAKLDALDDVNLLITPDVDDEANQQAAAAYCETRQDCFFIGAADVETYAALNRAHLGTNTRSACYVPFLKETNPINGAVISVSPAGAVAGVYARTDGARGVFKAPAGKIDGAIRSGLGLTKNISGEQQKSFNPKGVNVIRTFPDADKIIWGARTLSGDPQWRYVSVRRLLIFLEESIKANLKAVVFESNTPALWASVIRDISGFLRSVWSDGGLFGVTEEQAFFVKVDEENNPASSRALGRLIVDVGVAPVQPAEFVIIRISQETQPA